jgi:hypothetical protein
MQMPGWKFGEESRLRGSTTPSVLDLFCLCSFLILVVCAASGRPVIGIPEFHGLIGGLAFGWGVISTVHNLVKSYRIPGEDFLVGICLGTTFIGHALLSGAPVSGALAWSIWSLSMICASAFLARLIIRRRLIERAGP